ncbi:MAG: hypothetical protein NZ483_04070 [Verrucomicrobiae bacterium]|nr:hypothetical protein [Verrucomicrobiae bacterium]MDW8343383.1 hypothetical protein [Verrucomicrobiae bacterium]
MKPMLVCVAASLVAAAVHGRANEVKLTDLTPVAAEYGMLKDPQNVSEVEGAGKMDLGPYAVWGSFFWKDNRKIVKEVDPTFRFKEGETYNSKLENVFASGGKFVTGVGLWVKSRNMYHWIEYEVPAGATRFKAKLLASDDAHGYLPHRNPTNQEFFFRVKIDGQDAFALDKQRLQISPGGGEKLADIDIAVPANAKRIRFGVHASAWGDGNNNIELILNDAAFTVGR